MSISELAQLNAVGCGGEDVSSNQDFGRSIYGTHIKASAVVVPMWTNEFEGLAWVAFCNLQCGCSVDIAGLQPIAVKG